MNATSAARGEPAPITRVLIVDDSVVARAVLTRAIGDAGRFEIVAAVAGVRPALATLADARVDVILLDLDLPGIDGLTGLPDLLAAGRGAKVLVVSSAARQGAAATVQALALGAADTLVKPAPGESGARFADMLIEKLDRLVDIDEPPIAPPPTAAAAPSAFDVVAIGASTGGIHALGQLLRQIPATTTLPIVVTQHLPASFMPFFAAQLAVLAGRPCDVAEDRMRLRPGRIMVAPGDAHLRCVALPDGGAAARLSHEAAASGCLPSVDPMLASLAEVYGPRLLAVVLSGMGRDGEAGAKAVRDTGGGVVVQDRESSVVWGMPGAVARAGLADAVLAPDAIGRLIAERRRPS